MLTGIGYEANQANKQLNLGGHPNVGVQQEDNVPDVALPERTGGIIALLDGVQSCSTQNLLPGDVKANFSDHTFYPLILQNDSCFSWRINNVTVQPVYANASSPVRMDSVEAQGAGVVAAGSTAAGPNCTSAGASCGGYKRQVTLAQIADAGPSQNAQTLQLRITTLTGGVNYRVVRTIDNTPNWAYGSATPL